ncbi:hypothetical protein [Brachybacterium phenoliresistens]|uniref:hypothetical protein n=1 Tax=Brachybacterium phenoliresistens TaxID=396014 RepID=UPI0031D13D1D
MTTPPATFRSLLTAPARDALRPRTWRAAPPVEDREAWAHLAPEDSAHVLEAAGELRDRAAANPPTLSLWHRYAAAGERLPYEQAQQALLGEVGSAALALAVTGDDARAEALADAMWRLCELSAWCLPAHYALPESGERPEVPLGDRDILDLSCGYIGGMLAAIDSFAGDRLERSFPGLRARVHAEIRRRVLEPWRSEVYFWHGRDKPPNNWAPWIVSNVLVCAAVVEESADVLADDVAGALEILDRFRDGYAPDGSCDEGATYWWWAGATLFEALDVLHRISDGALDGFGIEPVPAMARFPMRMQIGTDTQVNYSDGQATVPSNVSWHLLTRFGAATGDEAVQEHGRWMGRRHPFRVEGQIAPQFLRTLHELRDPGWSQGPAAPGMPASWYAPGTETAVAREEAGSPQGWFLAAKGGHNDVSHNHNDVGGVIVSLDGAPVLIDVGVGVYRRETFDPTTRYGIWTMRSSYHCVPLPGGVEQRPGRDFAARGTEFADDGAAATLRMDLAPAYPPEAALESCERTARLERARPDTGADAGVLLRDAWRFTQPRQMSLVLMTALAPSLETDGSIGIGPALLTCEGVGVEAQVERIDVEDEKLAPVWGAAVHRLVLTQRDPAESGELSVRLTGR